MKILEPSNSKTGNVTLFKAYKFYKIRFSGDTSGVESRSIMFLLRRKPRHQILSYKFQLGKLKASPSCCTSTIPQAVC